YPQGSYEYSQEESFADVFRDYYLGKGSITQRFNRRGFSKFLNEEADPQFKRRLFFNKGGFVGLQNGGTFRFGPGSVSGSTGIFNLVVTRLSAEQRRELASYNPDNANHLTKANIILGDSGVVSR